MCGLTGIRLTKASVAMDTRSMVKAMTSALVHRGPDAKGIWAEDGIALGHRRLSILDLSAAGAQPMLSPNGRFVIAYNGEIYNHLDLRHDLGRVGAAPDWQGHSDTETLLASIEHWGLEETLRRASGMFALALWDRKAWQLSLARDRIGEKPLYWGWAGRSLVFGSELKALRQHPDFPRDTCRQALAQYMRFTYVQAPRSIHPGIYKIEPGCILTVDGDPPSTAPRQPLRPGDQYGSISIRRYWSLNEAIEAGARSQIETEAEAVTVLHDALRKAVGRQMISDVPLGAFLSGGIDSSLIVALMQAQSSRPVRTFTIGFEDPAFNEAPFAASVARHLRTDHTEMTVTAAQAREVIPLLPELYDEPLADSSQIPTYLVCRAARAHVTVALSGDGGDELFGGYDRYFLGARVWPWLDWIPASARPILGSALTALPVSAWNGFGAFTGTSINRLGDRAHKLAHRLRKVETVDDLYVNLMSQWTAEEVVNVLALQPASLVDDPMPSTSAHDPIGRMMVQDMRSYLPDDILCKVDRAAMGVSLETRAPFLDSDFLKIASRLPPHMKIRDGKGKWALREILYQHVPKELIERPKAGFGIPIGDWLRRPLREWAEDLLSEDALNRHGLIDPIPVRTVWHEHLSGRRDWTSKLWTILMFMAWKAVWE